MGSKETYWRFIDFSGDTLGISMYMYPPEKKNGQLTRISVSSRSLCEGVMPLQPAVTATFSEVL